MNHRINRILATEYDGRSLRPGKELLRYIDLFQYDSRDNPITVGAITLHRCSELPAILLRVRYRAANTDSAYSVRKYHEP